MPSFSGEPEPVELPGTEVPTSGDVSPEQAPEPLPALPAEQPSIQRQPRQVTLAEAMGMAAASGFFSFVLAVLFVLGLLVLLNGGLRFVRPAQLSGLQSEVSTIQADTRSLSSDLSGISTRLEKVEGLDVRVGDVEANARLLTEEISEAAAQVDSLTEKMDGVALQVDALVTRTSRFQNFLDGLRELLGSLAEPEVP